MPDYKDTILSSFIGLLGLLFWLAPGNTVSAQAQPSEGPIDSTFFKSMEYRMVGPYRGGRSTAVTGIPGKPYSYVMGPTGGGVWTSTNAGEDWTNVSDGDFGGGIGAVAVAGASPNVIYAGTGSTCIRGNISAGRGIYKSTDGGDSWSFIGLPEAGQIGDIKIHPRDPDLVYVAALGHPFGPNEQRGVFRSTDGGESWENVLFLSDSTGAVDLSMNPENPREIYASMWRAERKPWTVISGGAPEGGIYKTTDGGDSWDKLGGGLPSETFGKSAVSISAANPDRVWAIVEAEEPEGGVYRSDDRGQTWTRVNRDRKLRQRAYYYMHINADPNDENTVWALNTGLYKSTDGGETFEQYSVPHGDVHDLWINPNDSDKMVVANDGGAQVSLDGGESWSTMYNQPTAEFYSVTVDNQFPYHIYGPQQDNSTIRLPSWYEGGTHPKEYWRSVGGCETGPIALHPDHPDTIYSGCYGGVIDRTNMQTRQTRNMMVYPQLQLGQAPKDLRERFQWVSPIEVSPHDPNVVYHASQRIHRTSDGGHTWETISPDLTTDTPEHQEFGGVPITNEGTGVEVYNTVFALTPSPHEEGTLWAGTDDGRIHITRDEGGSWDEITPPEMPEQGTVNRIEVSPHQPGEAFVAVYRYRMDDFAPYIFHTTDYGESWEQLADGANGIPGDHPVRVVREDPDRKDLLYAGTEFGMFVSFDGGQNWQSFQRNLPTTPVTDLKVHQKDLVVATQGRSFWILDDLTPLHQLTDDVREAERHLFEPREAYLASPSQGRGDRWPEGPPGGAVLYYYFDEKPDTTVTVEILNEQGEVLRTFSSDSTELKAQERAQERAWMEDERFEAEQVRREIVDRERFEDERFLLEEEGPISAEQGLNRLVWNLRTDGFDDVSDAVTWGFTGGTKVPPGTYEVRLTVDGGNQTQSFQVQKDPRLEDVSEADLEEQFQLALEIRDTANEVYDGIRTLRSVRDQLKDVATRAARAGHSEALLDEAQEIIDELNAIESELIQVRSESRQDPINYPPRLDNQLASLYGYVAGPDGQPTEGARIRYRDLQNEWTEQQSRLQEALEDVEAFNAEAAGTDLPPVTVDGAY